MMNPKMITIFPYIHFLAGFFMLFNLVILIKKMWKVKENNVSSTRSPEDRWKSTNTSTTQAQRQRYYRLGHLYIRFVFYCLWSIHVFFLFGDVIVKTKKTKSESILIHMYNSCLYSTSELKEVVIFHYFQFCPAKLYKRSCGLSVTFHFHQKVQLQQSRPAEQL